LPSAPSIACVVLAVLAVASSVDDVAMEVDDSSDDDAESTTTSLAAALILLLPLSLRDRVASLAPFDLPVDLPASAVVSKQRLKISARGHARRMKARRRALLLAPSRPAGCVDLL